MIEAKSTSSREHCPACGQANPSGRMTCWRCGNWMDSTPTSRHEQDEDFADDWTPVYQGVSGPPGPHEPSGGE